VAERDQIAAWRRRARIYGVAAYLLLLVLFVGLAIVAVAFLDVHWALATFVFGVELASLAVGSLLGARAIRRRRRGANPPPR
jgi:hypothetical protein